MENKNDPNCLNCGVHGRCSCGLGSLYCKHLYSVNREDKEFEKKGIGYPSESIELLKFVFYRMLNVYGENGNSDYMIKFRDIINTIAKDSANFNINQQPHSEICEFKKLCQYYKDAKFFDLGKTSPC